MRLLQITLTAAALALGIQGCGGDEEETKGSSSTGGPIDAGDGRYRPPGNDVHTSEDAACSALSSAQDAKVQGLKCSITTRTCPSLLRVEFSTACMEYDEGSVQGCIDYYKKQTNCSDLAVAIKDCVVTPFLGTEPAGCPTP